MPPLRLRCGDWVRVADFGAADRGGSLAWSPVDQAGLDRGSLPGKLEHGIS